MCGAVRAVRACGPRGMKRSKSYTWLSGLLRPRPDAPDSHDAHDAHDTRGASDAPDARDLDEWGAPWVRADVMHHDRSGCMLAIYIHT